MFAQARACVANDMGGQSMSMKIIRLSSFLFAIAFAAAALCFDSTGVAGIATAQNANSSTTMAENTNAGTAPRKQGRRRKAPAPPAAADAVAAPAVEASESAALLDRTEQADLSGTYAGTFDCSDAGLTGETTLTITGNQFTTSDGKSGRITAATTRGYTGVAMQVGEFVPAAGTQAAVLPTIVSMRAKKSRDRLTLMSVPGATRVCSFTPAGAVSRSRRKPKPAPATAEVSQPAPVAEPVAAPVTPAEPVKPTEAVTPVVPVTPTEPAAAPGAEAGPMPPTAAPAAGRSSRKARRSTAKPKPAPATPPN